MQVISQRLADKGILRLIRLWLLSPVQQPDGQLEKSRIGTPQGGVISPLPANIYLYVFDEIINNPDGVYAKEDIRIVRNADDCVLMKTRHYPPKILRRMKRTLNRRGFKSMKRRPNCYT